MKNQLVPKNNMNIIPTQQMNINNANLSVNNNFIRQGYNPSYLSTNLINYGYNPIKESNINIIYQKQIQMINNNQLPVTYIISKFLIIQK